MTDHALPFPELRSWLDDRDPFLFPYGEVLEEYQRVGKHFVPLDLLDLLDGARTGLAGTSGPIDAVRELDNFLDTALDKRDGRYDYRTYLALSTLPLPTETDGYAVRRDCDRLVVQLMADTLRFELESENGESGLLTMLRPDARTTAKRCRLGLRAVRPAVRRLGLAGHVDSDDPRVAARQLDAVVRADLTNAEFRALKLSMLPVHVVHDEYLFIRVLQMFETTFAALAVLLRSAVTALAEGVASHAAGQIDVARVLLREAAPLFSLLATMQVEAFRAFRVYTEGASAIQSRNYKIVESLCRPPDEDRLNSAAYLSVPEVRERVLAGAANLDEAFSATRAATGTEHRALAQAMGEFAATLTQWRRTHYSIAVRMLGERGGTGYTQGPPYLREARTVPVFRSVPEWDAPGRGYAKCLSALRSPSPHASRRA